MIKLLGIVQLGVYITINCNMYTNNGCGIYMDIKTGENCRQFSLLPWNLFTGQFVHLVVRKGIG